MDPAITAIIGALIPAIGAIVVALIQSSSKSQSRGSVVLPPGVTVSSRPRPITWKAIAMIGAFALVGGVVGYTLGGKRELPTSTPTIDFTPSPLADPGSASEPNAPVFIQTYFFGDRLRILRCESSQWNCTNSFPGSMEYVDFPKMRLALQEMIAIVFFTTSDRVALGDFIMNKSEISVNVTILGSELDDKGLYNSAHIDIGERSLDIALFDENGDYYQPKNKDALGWDQSALKGALRGYLIATVSNISPETIVIGELDGMYYSDGSGHMSITFVYSRTD